MATIIDEILKHLPENAQISETIFEGANIILYTKSREFFLNHHDVIRNIVSIIKKRVELRPDASITVDPEKAEAIIRKILPEDAGITKVIFDIPRSIVIIDAERPGVAIGKQGELLREIKQQVYWVPFIRRTPAIRSQIIENIHAVLYENNDYRKKFLDKVGHRIYDGWLRGEKKQEWIRLTVLGAGRQVGRSCMFLQTPESRILIDCGVNVAATEQDAYPQLDSPEFRMEELDAVILAHSHIDHGGFIPYLYKMGYRGPVYATAPTRDVISLLTLDFIGVAFKQAKKALYAAADIREMVKHTICLDYGEVTDITPDIRLTFYNAGHILGSSMVHLHIGNGLHNLLYSLDGKTPVTVLDKNDQVDFKPIGEVIDDLFKKYPALIQNKGAYERLTNPEELKTIVFDPKTYKTVIKKITGFIRHPIHEDLYEIATASGRKATVTKSHSVFSVIEGEVRAVKVADLKVGDFIIGPKTITPSSKKPVIDLLQYKSRLRISIDDEDKVRQQLEEHKKKFHHLQEKDRKEAEQWIFDHYKYALYKREIAKKYRVHVRRITRVWKMLGIASHPRVKEPLPHKFPITKEFARFLGYYVAEGCIRKNSQTVVVTNNNFDILKECQDIIKKTFNTGSDLRRDEKGTGNLLIHSKQLKYLLCEVLRCGLNAYKKRVPKEIRLADKDIMREFLHGYFSGDGGITIKEYGRHINASSKNQLLIQDITFMLLQFGIVPTLQYNAYTKMHIATIYEAEKISQFMEEIGMQNNSSAALKAIIKTIRHKAGFANRIPLVALSKKGQLALTKSAYRNAKTCGINILQEKFKMREKIMQSDFMFDQTVTINKVPPTSKWVYDFQVKGYENFLGGEGFLFLHNTSDFKYVRTALLEAADARFPRLETVIMESTYGAKTDVLNPRKESEDALLDTTRQTIERGGKVLIPVLGVGRSQEIMLILEEAMRTGKLVKIPIYIHGMVWDITAIHTAYPDFLNRNIRKAIFHKDENPFLSDIFKRVGSKKEQDQVINEEGPCIILATAGFLNAGASLEYFKALADNPKNTVIFVSYQYEGSVGRKVQAGDREVQLPNTGERPETVKVNMTVKSISSLTGHAGRNELMRFIHDLVPRPKKIIINHGEASKCLDLASSLYKTAHIETIAPRNLDSIRLL